MSNSLIQNILQSFTRRKRVSAASSLESKLRRCLTIFDLVTLGIGSTLGAGIYILAGDVAKFSSGGGVILSFLFAGIASMLAGLSYAELAARFPRAGSAFNYTYTVIGELAAFVTGWNLILEYVVGAASTARAWSSSVDAVMGFRMSSMFQEYFPVHMPPFAPYLDITAFTLTIIATIILATGVKESSKMNNICTAINLICVAIIIIIGSSKVNFKNWKLTREQVRTNATFNAGNGGFIPYGISGVLSGAATCFYAFVGFDLVATTGEETQDPRKAIPLSICLVLLVCCGVYCGIAAVLTLMVPYYSIRVEGSLPDAFNRVGLPSVTWIITFGAVTGLTASLIGSLFPLPRVCYAMALDGLLFSIFGEVNENRIPIYGTICGGLLSAIMALIFDMITLVEMMSIGTLIAYTLVSIAVVILRYEKLETINELDLKANDDQKQRNDKISASPSTNIDQLSITSIVGIIVLLIIILCMISIHLFENHDSISSSSVILFCIVTLVLILVTYFGLAKRQQYLDSTLFHVPYVPWFPVLSILFNIYLMLKLKPATWMRFLIWMIAGFSIYFGYGMKRAGKIMAN